MGLKRFFKKALRFGAWVATLGLGGSVLGGALGKIATRPFWKTALGRGVISVGTNVAEGQLNSHFNMRRMQRLGLTPQEMYGAGVAGGSGSAGNMLGNNLSAQVMQEKQQLFQAGMQERQIEAGLAQSRIAANASIASSQIAADASKYGSDTTFEIANMSNHREWQKMANAWAVNNPEMNMRLKQLSIGVENMVVELILQRNGLDLSGNPDLSQAQFNQRMSAVMSELAATQGWSDILREGARQGTAAVNDVLDHIAGGGKRRPIVGNLQPAMPVNPATNSAPVTVQPLQ